MRLSLRSAPLLLALALPLGLPRPSLAEDAPAPGKEAPGAARKKKKKAAEPKADDTRTAAPDRAPAGGGSPAPSSKSSIDEEYGPAPAPSDNVVVAAPRRKPFGRGKLLVGARVGGAFPEVVSNFGPSFLVGLEVGWVLPRLPGIGEGLAATIDLAYSQPEASATLRDPHVASTYSSSVTQRELSLGLTVLYRVPNVMGGKLTPYLGIGPRLFFLESLGKAQPAGGGGVEFSETSTRIGMGLPVGVDYALGPGRLFLEAMFLYAPFNHNTTGSTNAGAITIEAGYRMLFGLGG